MKIEDGSVSKRSSRKKTSFFQTHDEENQTGEESSRKKIKTKLDLEKETKTEAMIALCLGFPIDRLLEEEIRAGVVRELGGKEQNDYIVVRNHILAKWRHNVRIYLSKEEIKETVSRDYAHLISSAFDFLFFNGFINFGVSPSFEPRVAISGEANRGSVIVIGAGLAGLASASQLLGFGFKVIVLEGRNRAGGRVYTRKMGRDGNFAAVELGGSVITGVHANPLAVLARQLSVPLHKVRDFCPLYNPDGSEVEKEVDSKVEVIFNKLLDKILEAREKLGGFASDESLGSVLEKLRRLYAVAGSGEERRLLDWHLANLEYANAGCLADLSATHWDQDDPFEMGGDHCFLAGGNSRLITALSQNIPIFYSQTVESIRYDGPEGVEVVVAGENRVFRADAVLCTVPLGVLKKKTVEFRPQLPQRKLDAIERLGFGLLNKVAMLFPRVFWGEELDTFGCLNEDGAKRGEFFLFYAYHTVSGGPVLIALVAGEAAKSFESTDPNILLHRVLNVLRGIYKRKGVEVPDPIQTICTKWGSDPLSYGSYSHLRVRSSGSDYDVLAESVGNRLFFAGEATTSQYPATMHGAFLSGLREASKILRAVSPEKKNLSLQSNNNSEVLLDLFKKPDVSFGSFSFVFDPFSRDSSAMGLMRVSFDCRRGDRREDNKRSSYSFRNNLDPPVHLYASVSCHQAKEIELVREGDEARLSFLVKDLGLELMGLAAIGNLEASLINSIATTRKGRGRNRMLAWQS